MRGKRVCSPMVHRVLFRRSEMLSVSPLGRPPWMVPVPVRQSDYVPLRPQHADLNVETALGRITAYGATTTAPQDVLLADLQDNPDTSVRGRLGSGRTGFYRGRYLKGVGRTLLAGNWANPADADRHTGLMEPSAAIRELIVTAYLRARGCEDAIVPCEGVLFKPLAAEARAYVEQRSFWGASSRLQAMTVKAGGFSRPSNLAWLANHLDFYRSGDAATSLATFVRTFLATVGGGGGGPLHASIEDATPDALATAFFAYARRGLENLRRFWRAGVSWPSLHNNFASDGRFVDIDWPIILGTPLVGVVATRGVHPRLDLPHHDTQRGLFEALYFVLHVRMLSRFFMGRLRAIAASGYPVQRAEREFALAAARAFASSPDEALLFSRRDVTRMLVGWVEAEMDLDTTRRRALACAIDAVQTSLLLLPCERRPTIELRAGSARIAPLGSGDRPVPHVLAGMPEHPVQT
ncbi:MAG TPA: hypothetical protein VF765_12105, partial [Polyangiaceae bacterium]